MNEYISPKSMKHPPEGVLARERIADYRDGLRAEIAADRILSAAGAERLLHAIDNDGANRYEPPVCSGCDGSRMVPVPCPDNLPGCLVYHHGPCPNCSTNPVGAVSGPRYEPPECAHGVRFREWCFGCFSEFAAEYAEFKRDTKRALRLIRTWVVSEMTDTDARWLMGWLKETD